MLAAVAALAREEAPVWAVGLVGEEADSRGAKRFLREAPRSIRHIVIGEPTGGDGVAIGYRGSARIVVECRGEGGHSASPWEADSALDKAVELVEKLRQLPRGVDAVTYTPVRLEAGRGDNVVPTEALLVLNTRIPVGSTAEEALARLRGLLPEGCEARLEGETVPPVRVSLNEPVPRALVRSLIRCGRRPRPVVKAGTSDMNYLVALTRSIAAYGPGDPRLAHTTRERVSAGELELAARVYLYTVDELLSARR
jgi:LysW-gamma-L-lysine carboxypeptidase